MGIQKQFPEKVTKKSLKTPKEILGKTPGLILGLVSRGSPEASQGIPGDYRILF